tara:strand:- start:1763 stop:2881 length:1119 start_codon:yes stop_codon:yes gene_type:complete
MYMSKLLSQGGFGCVFHPGLNCNAQPTNNNSIATKVQIRNFNSENETEIGEIISSHEGYKLFFLPVIDRCALDIRKADKTELNKCEVIKSMDEEYVAMNIPFVQSMPFTEVLSTLKSRDIVLTTIETYKYLLMALDKLHTAKVVHFDLKMENILFTKGTTDPRIIDFGISIPMENLDDHNMHNYFYVYAPDYYVWCLDINVIAYIINETDNVLTEDDAVEIAELTAASCTILDDFGSEFADDYRDMCIRQAKTYVGKNRDEVVYDLLSKCWTWDNYSLSIMFIKVLTSMFPSKESRNKLVVLFLELLIKNIDPNPDNRLSIEETQKHFDDIFFMDGIVSGFEELGRTVKEDKTITITKFEQERHHLKLPTNK